MTTIGTTQEGKAKAAGTNAIRPFTASVPDAELTELRQRIAAARYPERETVADDTQGVQLATIQKLARYWATDYDWRKCEAKLEALPSFTTEIDGMDIHFIHVRSKHDDPNLPGRVTASRRRSPAPAVRVRCRRSACPSRRLSPSSSVPDRPARCTSSRSTDRRARRRCG
jgi:hypothetical protein